MNEHRQRLVDLATSFPDVVAEEGGEDGQHMGFSVRKKRFAWYLDDHHGDGIVALTCKAAPGVNTSRIAEEPERFFLPSYTGKRGWLGARLDLVDWDEVVELVDDAYRLTAPKTLITQLDERTR